MPEPCVAIFRSEGKLAARKEEDESVDEEDDAENQERKILQICFKRMDGK